MGGFVYFSILSKMCVDGVGAKDSDFNKISGLAP